MNNKIRTTSIGSAKKTVAFFTRFYLPALVAILFIGAVAAAAGLWLPAVLAGSAERGGETAGLQPGGPESTRRPGTGPRSLKKQQSNVWTKTDRNSLTAPVEGLADEFGAFRLDRQQLASLLSSAPHESTVPLGQSETMLELPYPDGTLHTFRIQEAPVLESSLAARYPEIKSYRALAVDDPGTTARFDLTPRGFHALILTPDKSVSVLPADKTDESLYASSEGASQTMEATGNFSCAAGAEARPDQVKDEGLAKAAAAATPVTALPVGRKLKTYRIAVAATYDYTTDRELGGGTKALTVATINTWINSLSAIYERELSIRFLMVDNTGIIWDTENDPYSDVLNPDAKLLHNQVKKQLSVNVGKANYNLGHLFTKYSGGGVAGLGNVCDDREDYDNGQPDGNGPRKGAGYSSMNGEAGNLGTLKVFAHEIGHQFGAEHTFNGLGCAGNDGTNRSPTSSYEPGSGNTIMSYHGVCNADNLVGTASEALRFHTHSLTQITDYIYNDSTGSSCGTLIDINNSAPNVVQPESYKIPKMTPFTLTASAAEPDLGDVNNLTYAWEQYQPGGATFTQNGTAETYNDANDPSSTTRPIFRATPPTTSASRTFPSLTYILNNQNDPPFKDPVSNLITGEALPRIGRTLNFRVTARDSLGGVAYKETPLTVVGDAGPFRVTAPNTAAESWTAGTSRTVTWDVANTNNVNGVNTALVKILLSVDGGQTFPTALKDAGTGQENTLNDGSVQINVPANLTTTTARIKIQAVENIYFDVSDTNFSIVLPSNACPSVTSFTPNVAVAGTKVVITGLNFTGADKVTFGGIQAASFTIDSSTKITATAPTGAQGGAIKVTKNGCSAESPAGAFSFCSGTVQTLSVDDGIKDADNFSPAGQTYLINRLTPDSYPATLTEVRIYHSSIGFPKDKAITIVSGANSAGGPTISSNTVFNKKDAKIGVLDAYETYQVDPITITSGDFLVGYGYSRAEAEPAFPAAADTTSQPLNRSYYSNNLIGFGTIDTGVFMLRAGIIYNASSTVINPVDDGTLEFRGGTSVGTNYRVNRITPLSYPATLSEVRIFHPAEVPSTDKQITILSAAHPLGSMNINGVSFNTKAATIREKGKYVSYPIDPITISSGDFLVGYSFKRDAGEAEAYPVALDTTKLSKRSYESADGKNFTDVPAANFMIRAVTTASLCTNGACTYSLALTGGIIPRTGGTGALSVTTQPGCVWKASRNVAWITMTGAVEGTGSGTVPFKVDANTGTARTGGISFLGRIMIVPQTLFGLQSAEEDPDNPEFYETQAIAFAQEPEYQPTAAAVSISGQVISGGKGIAGSQVRLTDAGGRVRTVMTNPFGNFTINDVPAGMTYVVNVSAKKYTFVPQVVSVTDNISGLTFAAQ